MDIFLIGTVSYLIGSIPFGFLLTKIFLKKDIREIGSGNIGATNALRTGNKVIGYSTLILDILKAVFTIIYVKIFFQELIHIAALCVFLGHVFPIWLKFKGGKGVASYVGILCALDIYFGIVFAASLVITFLIFRYSSLSSLVGAASLPIYLLILTQFDQAIFFTIMFVLIFFTHRENIKRLKNKEETRTKIY